MKKTKRAISALLTALMCISTIGPVQVMAEEANTAPIKPMSIPAASLPEAVDGKITLNNDVSLTDMAVFTEDTVLDLAGYTIDGCTVEKSGRAIRVDKGTLTVKDTVGSGKIVLPANSGGIAIIVNGGELLFEGGAIQVSGQDACGIRVQEGGAATMKGGAISANGMGAMGAAAISNSATSTFTLEDGSIDVSGQGSMGIYLAGQAQKAIISGGTITVAGDDSYGIQTIKMGDVGHEMTISGGSISVSGNKRTYAVYMELDNKMNITGGTLESKTGPAVVYFQGGNSGSITGGTVIGKTYGIYILNSANNTLTISDGAVICGDAGSIMAGGNRNKSTPAVTISGGKFKGAIAGGVPTDKTDNYAIYDITGGYFTIPPTDSALYNYEVSKNATPGTYKESVENGNIIEVNEVAQSGDEEYPYMVSPKKQKIEFVLMNIPYDKFYQAELVQNSQKVDAVTSATLNKPRTGTLAGGSYHKNEDGSDISGVIYPVKVEDLEKLEALGGIVITDDSSIEITTTNRGQTSTITYKGKDALFEARDYSYYVLKETPAYYKVLRADGDFSEVKGESTTVEGVTGEITVGARHADIEIKLNGLSKMAEKISGVVLTTESRKTYGLRHVANLWRGTEIGWNLDELDLAGQTIKNIRFYTQEEIIDYPVDLKISNPGYVLMNIPYDEFYGAELAQNSQKVDAVTSATLNKPRTGTLAGGSYHKDPKGTDISGVIYPVFVKEMSDLNTELRIDEDTTVLIEVTNKGNTVQTEYKGKDALFEAEDYSYYVLEEKPARYKVLNIAEGGKKEFSAVSGRAKTIEGATGEVNINGRHANTEIPLELPEGIKQGDVVSAVVLTTDKGDKYGLRHIANLWRATEIGWNEGELNGIDGAVITNIRYITQSDVLDYPVQIAIPKETFKVTFKVENGSFAGKNGAPSGQTEKTVRVAKENGVGTLSEALIPDTQSMIPAEDFEGGVWDVTPNIAENGITEDVVYTYIFSAVPKVEVTFDSNGGSEVAPLTVVKGQTIESPEAPTKRGQRFDGWYLNGTLFDFATPIEEDIKLVAKWKNNSSSSGGGGSAASAKNEVSIKDAEHGVVSAAAKTAAKGDKVTLTAKPENGYEVDRITAKDKNGKEVEIKQTGENTFTFIMPEGKVTIEAAFKESESTEPVVPVQPEEPNPTKQRYSDISDTRWSKGDIDYVVEKGLMFGVTDTSWGPTLSTTRGMILTVLYRLEGKPEVNSANPFSDVPRNSYYENAITWAAASNIVSGYGEGKFGPNDDITREQLATILYNFAKFKGYDVSKAASLNGYKDAGKASAYAVPALQWAVAEGLIAGDNGNLNPRGKATREQLAAVIHRFCENMMQ